jgi:hypothetical protein
MEIAPKETQIATAASSSRAMQTRRTELEVSVWVKTILLASSQWRRR